MIILCHSLYKSYKMMSPPWSFSGLSWAKSYKPAFPKIGLMGHLVERGHNIYHLKGNFFKYKNHFKNKSFKSTNLKL